MGDRPSGIRHGLSVPTGKPADMAASGHPCGALRPGQITPGRLRQPPAQPGACARHAGKVRGDRKATKNRLAGRKQASTASRTTSRVAERPQGRFSRHWIGQGMGAVACGIPAPYSKFCAETVLKFRKALSCKRLSKFDAPHHSPPPLASEGSESPSDVRDAGGGALRFLDCTPD